MDLAVSSVILILLLLPALFLRTFIIRSDSLENPLDTSIKTETGIIFLIAIIQHLFGLIIINLNGTFQIYFDQFYYILSGEPDKINDAILNYSLSLFLYYTLFQISLGIAFAVGAKRLILRYYLDIHFKFLPISNEWDQVLSGRIWEYDRIMKINSSIKDLRKFQKDVISNVSGNIALTKTEKKEIRKQIHQEIKELKKTRRIPPIYNYVEIDVLVNTASGDMIYKGRVFKYYLGKDNTLDKIVLKDAFRRKFIDVKDETSKKIGFYEFESKLFVIKYSEIKNLNVRYTFIEETSDEADTFEDIEKLAFEEESKKNIATTT